jgi:hypothetical protein
MESNEKSVEELKAQLTQDIIEEQLAAPPSLEEVAQIGKSMLTQYLMAIEAHKETVTLTGFVKALRLALVHDVAPELQEKVSLINKQQFLAGMIAKAIDTKFNLKMNQLGQEMRKEEAEASKEGVTNGN